MLTFAMYPCECSSEFLLFTVLYTKANTSLSFHILSQRGENGKYRLLSTLALYTGLAHCTEKEDENPGSKEC